MRTIGPVHGPSLAPPVAPANAAAPNATGAAAADAAAAAPAAGPLAPPASASPAASAAGAAAPGAAPAGPLQSSALQPALAALREMPEIDHAKVAELRDALARGAVPFNAARLASLIERFHGSTA